MQFVIDEGRGRGYDESAAVALLESAARLQAMGATPSAVRVSESFYAQLSDELPCDQYPSLPMAKLMQARGHVLLFDGMRLEIVSSE